MTALTRWVLSHKRIVVAGWIVLTIVGGALAGKATKAMNQKFTVPGKEGFVTNERIKATFGGTGGDNGALVPVVTLPAGTTVRSSGVRAALGRVDAAMARANPGSRIASYASTGSRAFVSANGRTVFSIVYPRPDLSTNFGANPKAAKRATAAAQRLTVAGAPVRVTGYDALQNQTGGGNGPGVFIEALLGGLGALLVLAAVFGSFLAIVPILMAIVSIMTSFLIVYGETTVAGVSPIVQFLIALIGLGVAIDYSLLVVVRWREERSHGREGDAAIVRAMQTAGRAVVFSGTTVAIGLLALIALPLPFLRSVGYGGMVIPLISTLVAITLLPILLHGWGNKLDWPHRRTDDKAGRAWTRWAQIVVHRRWLAALGAGLLLLAFVVAATRMELGAANPDSIAKSGQARAGLVALERSGIGAGAISPHEIVTRTTSPATVVQALDRVPGIHGAVAPTGSDWRRNGISMVEAFGTANGAEKAATDTLKRVRVAAHDTGPDVRVGGSLAEDDDFINAVYGNFPLLVLLIAVVTYVLLARAFRSLLLPLKAIVLNIVSIGAAWGILQLVWQSGHGSNLLFGVPATGSIPSWMPIVVFAFLFGLSMDYEVFILSRMREEYDATGDTNTAVVRGIGRTGRLVTSAALILFLAFVSLGSAPNVSVQQLATGLAAGIALDATIVRALFVPALVSLFGRWNWWLPARPARWLRVAPSHGEA